MTAQNKTNQKEQIKPNQATKTKYSLHSLRRGAWAVVVVGWGGAPHMQQNGAGFCHMTITVGRAGWWRGSLLIGTKQKEKISVVPLSIRNTSSGTGAHAELQLGHKGKKKKETLSVKSHRMLTPRFVHKSYIEFPYDMHDAKTAGKRHTE